MEMDSAFASRPPSLRRLYQGCSGIVCHRRIQSCMIVYLFLACLHYCVLARCMPASFGLAECRAVHSAEVTAVGSDAHAGWQQVPCEWWLGPVTERPNATRLADTRRPRGCVRRRGFRGTLRPCDRRGFARRSGFRCTLRPCETCGCARRRGVVALRDHVRRADAFGAEGSWNFQIL